MLVRYVVTSLRYALYVHCRGFSCVQLWVPLCFELYTAPFDTRRFPSEFLAMSPILLLRVSQFLYYLLHHRFPLAFRHLFPYARLACIYLACIYFASLLFPVHSSIRNSVRSPSVAWWGLSYDPCAFTVGPIRYTVPVPVGSLLHFP